MNRCPICSKVIESNDIRYSDENDIVYHWSCWINEKSRPVPINPIKVIETRQKKLEEFGK